MLSSLQEQLQSHADTISQVTGLDVEVVDTDLIRIAGTGVYADEVGSNIKQAGNLLKATLAGELPLFIENPRENKICRGCRNKVNCKELLSICAPISDGNTLYGAIELICFSKVVRERVLSQREIYINFLVLLAKSFADRAREKFELQDITSLLNAMSEVVSTNDKGTIIFDALDKVVYNNQRAKEILKKSLDSQYENFSIAKTGDTFSDLDEFLVTHNGRSQLVVGKKITFNSPTNRFASVFVFDTIQSIISPAPPGPSYEDSPLNHIIGNSPLVATLKEQIRATALTNSSVLITGESGTGKELVARAIHAIGDRADANFVAINCGAIPDTLLESELFGYVGGAFTGALEKGQIGKFELAEGGVLFLDEISTMPLYLQVKILRVLQERTITRLGASRTVSVDIRIVATTNDNLDELMAQNMFRRDLFYRLNVIPLQVPPLRKRLDDIDLLVSHFANKYCTLFEKKLIKLPPSIVNKMRLYDWPGNIRELENAIEYLVNIAGEDGSINTAAIHANFLCGVKPSSENEQISCSGQAVIPLKEMEKQAILRALSVFGDTTQGKKAAANRLGISLATLYRKLNEG